MAMFKQDSCIKTNLITGKCIGRGTFSTVFQIKNLNNDQKFALKKVYIAHILDTRVKNGCINEVHLLQQLQHPNIIKYFYHEFDSQTLNLVLELAPLGDLSHYISHHIRKVILIPEKIIWKFIVQLCSVLHYIHSNRIMHRDLKPANIFLSEQENIKIGDFGFGKMFTTESKPYAKSFLGSPYYMSPERLLQKKYFFNSDIWSLGCIIYEQLAALQSPFYVNKLDINLLIKRVVKCEYPPLASDVYSKELHNVIDVCMMTDCFKRPQADYVFALACPEYIKYLNE